MSTQLVLAVDGGNSKTDVALVTEHGELLAQVRGAGSSPHHLGLSRCVRLLDELVRTAWERAGLTQHSKADLAEVYLAGADLPVEVAQLREAVGAAGWAAEFDVANDAFALLRAGTPQPDAVAVVCGAGINAVGRTSGGRTAAFPSLGQITGDWGGGKHLGYEALWHAARAEDGRGQPSSLRQLVQRHFGRGTVAEVGEAMHLGSIPEDRIIELTPLVFEATRSGDAVAGRVVQRLADEIAVLAEATLRRLGVLEAAVPVVLGGGVLRAQHFVLVPLVSQRLLPHAPEASLTVVTSPPVLGAALRGLDVLHATERAKGHVAAALPAGVTPLR